MAGAYLLLSPPESCPYVGLDAVPIPVPWLSPNTVPSARVILVNRPAGAPVLAAGKSIVITSPGLSDVLDQPARRSASGLPVSAVQLVTLPLSSFTSNSTMQ